MENFVYIRSLTEIAKTHGSRSACQGRLKRARERSSKNAGRGRPAFKESDDLLCGDGGLFRLGRDSHRVEERHHGA